MELVQGIKERRSIRKFDAQRPVSRDVLERIVEAASYAPSWKHTQIARYIAVTGAAKDRLAECTQIWANNGNILRNAPMAIALCAVTGRSGYERDGSYSTSKGSGWQMFDAGAAAEAFCLAAHEEGLGTVILGLYDDNSAEVLGVPEGQELIALIPIGYPAESPEAPKRKSVQELLSFRE